MKKSLFLCHHTELYFLVSLRILCYSVFLPEEKIEKNIKMAQKLSCKKSAIIRDLASFIGLVINAFHAVLEAQLHYRALERDKVRGLDNCYDFDQFTNLSEESLSELNWWIKNVKVRNGKHIRPPKPSICIQNGCILSGLESL